MEKRVISFSPPDISEAEIAEVVEALRSGWIPRDRGQKNWKDVWLNIAIQRSRCA